jgi:hypothetical protein
MAKMLRATVEFPLDVLAECGFPLVLLRKAQFLNFLRQDRYGFQISYEVPTAQVAAFTNKLLGQYEAVLRVEPLPRRNEDGRKTLFMQGRWLREGGLERRDRAAKTLRSLFDCQTSLVRPPQVVAGKVRVSMLGEVSRLKRMLARFEQRKVPFRIEALAEPAAR